jgi:NADH:ubiquinone oxidoreductase subunit 2 (subunit N)
MTGADLFALAPAGIFLLGALLSLLFEAAGTPIAARKQGPRTHIALLGLATCAAVLAQAVASWDTARTPQLAFDGLLALDHIGLLGTAAVTLCIGLVLGAAVPGLRERDADYGESYALLLFAGAALCLLVVARELLTVAAAMTLSSCALVALCTVDRRAPQGTEAAVKLMQGGGVLLALLAFGAALRYGATGATELCAGEPMGAFLVGIALLTLVVPPLAALDQSRVRRVSAHLLIAQAGPVLVALFTADGTAGGLGPYWLAVAATMAAAVGAVVGLSFLERAGTEGSTWEAWSGAGRQHPLFGLSLIWLWASLAGIPGTAGFAARLVVGQAAFAAGEDLLGLAVFVAPALAAAPVVRLAIFLFSRAPDRALDTVPSGWRAVVVALACLAVLALGLFPLPLLELAATMRFF